MQHANEPRIIQGGMGVAVSGWKLARAVSLAGQLGVVSGTAMDVVLARRLQAGDADGQMRHALLHFPYPEMTERILERYFIPGGKKASEPYRPTPMPSIDPSPAHLELMVAANFVEVFLAGEGHSGLVGVNLLEKIQAPTLPSLYGAMLAGVDYVLMGAGIPRAIPGVLDRLSRGERAELPLHVVGAAPGETTLLGFDPQSFGLGPPPVLKRPKFLAIVASVALANMLVRKASGQVDGFVVEGPTAGGHNAPPRGEAVFDERGEPVYGERDVVDLAAMQALGRPFWLAGSYGSPAGVRSALESGAAGVQVGTAFAFCGESGFRDDIKRGAIRQSKAGEVRVSTDPVASPTGFPFKVMELEGTLSEESAYNERTRVCDLGYLRHAYKRPDGKIGWRCPGEKVEAYVQKGGDVADTVGRKCVCNALVAGVGLGQVRRDGYVELPLVTCGNEARDIARFLQADDAESYSARDVIDYLLSGVVEPAAAREQRG